MTTSSDYCRTGIPATKAATTGNAALTWTRLAATTRDHGKTGAMNGPPPIAAAAATTCNWQEQDGQTCEEQYDQNDTFAEVARAWQDTNQDECIVEALATNLDMIWHEQHDQHERRNMTTTGIKRPRGSKHRAG